MFSLVDTQTAVLVFWVCTAGFGLPGRGQIFLRGLSPKLRSQHQLRTKALPSERQMLSDIVVFFLFGSFRAFGGATKMAFEQETRVINSLQALEPGKMHELTLVLS